MLFFQPDRYNIVAFWALITYMDDKHLYSNFEYDSALTVNAGVKQPEQVSNSYVERMRAKRASEPSVEELVSGILHGDRMLLSRAITLVESSLFAHQQKAQEVIERCLPYSGKSVRLGITGVPGAGKSTIIEAMGKMLTGHGHKVAVLAIDPSSERSKGSILGDKTRMEELSVDPNAFIRPSPSAGSLGGVVALDMKRAMTSYPNLLDTRFRESSNQAGVAVNGDSGATESIWNTLTELLANTLGFSLYLVLLSGLNIWLAAVTTVMTVLGFLVNLRLSRWGYAHREERAKFVNALSYSTNLLLERNYAKDIRIFGITDWVQEVWTKNLKLFRSFAEKNQRHLFWGNLLDAVLALLRNGLAYFVLVSMVLRQEITVSEFLLYFSAVSGFTAWVTGILDGVFTLHRQCLDISKVREFLDWKEPFRFESGTELPEKPYEFRFENVSYRYPGAKEDTIKNLDLTIHSGEKLAIVGLNGAGKTTLIKLLAGFLDPNEGRVLLNGTDIREFDRRKYYELFSAVFQDFSVLPATIRENVTQSLDKPDIERLWRALELAGLSSHRRRCAFPGMSV